MDEIQHSFRYHPDLRRPTPAEREIIAHRGTVLLQKELKYQKIIAEIRLSVVFLLLLVLVWLASMTEFVAAVVVCVTVVSFVRVFRQLLAESRRLKKRISMLQQGSFRVAEGSGQGSFRKQNGKMKYQLEIQSDAVKLDGSYLVPYAERRKLKKQNRQIFSVLLVQFPDDPQLLALLPD